MAWLNPDSAEELRPPLLQERIVRVVSGWGALAGLAAGAYLGLQFGWLTAIGFAAVGLICGSLLGIVSVILFAYTMHWLGRGGLVIVAFAIAAATWFVVFQR